MSWVLSLMVETLYLALKQIKEYIVDWVINTVCRWIKTCWQQIVWESATSSVKPLALTITQAVTHHHHGRQTSVVLYAQIDVLWSVVQKILEL